MKIGFIGLGIMGKPMAKNLIKAGHELVVYDVVPASVSELVESGAKAGKSCADVAARSDLVITMLPNSPHVKTAVLGEDGVMKGIRPGTIFVDMSSIAPTVSIELSAELAKVGVPMLDAPVSGGEPKAKDGTLAIMVGGPADVFDKVKDIFAKLGSSVTLVGDIGSGNMAKLANQIMVAANIAGMSEALTLAAKAGTNPEIVYKAVRAGLAGSTVLDAKAPMVLEGNYKPGFRIELHIKDLQNALITAEKYDAPAPISAAIIEMMKKLRDEGHGADDHGGLIQYYEELAGVKVRK